MFCLHVYLCTMCMKYAKITEENIGSPGAGVRRLLATYGC